MAAADEGLTTADGPGTSGPTSDAPEADLTTRVAELEATVARLTQALEQRPSTAPNAVDVEALWPGALPHPTDGSVPRPADAAVRMGHAPRPDDQTNVGPTGDEPANERPTNGSANDGPTGFDRRRLLSRAGTAAVGAVIGGAAASIAAASPAAAASASFDTSTSTPAVDAVSTGTGPAVRARNDDVAMSLALEAIGTSRLNGNVLIGTAHLTNNRQLQVNTEKPIGIEVFSGNTAVLVYGPRFGVMAESAEVALVGIADTGIGLITSGGKAGLLFRPNGSAPAPPPAQTIAHEKGEVVFDGGANLWLCTADGTPGTWVRLGGASSAGAFTALSNPVRVYDSRPGAVPTDVGPKQPLAPNTPRTVDLTKNSSGVPTDAAAAVVTATVTSTTGGSPNGPAYLALYRDGTSWPGTSTLNWTAPGSTIATTTVVPLGPGAKLAAYAAAATDLIIDVVGYYR